MRYLRTFENQSEINLSIKDLRYIISSIEDKGADVELEIFEPTGGMYPADRYEIWVKKGDIKESEFVSDLREFVDRLQQLPFDFYFEIYYNREGFLRNTKFRTNIEKSSDIEDKEIIQFKAEFYLEL